MTRKKLLRIGSVMRHSRIYLVLAIFFIAAFYLQSAEKTRKKICEPKEPTREMCMIANLAVQVISRQHFNSKPIDAVFSSEFFDEYLKTLDPTHSMFTQADIAKLEPKRYTIAEDILKRDISFAFTAYRLLLMRVRQYAAFANEQLDKGFDFTKSETYMPDRAKQPWMQNEQSLRELWRKRLKNDMISITLADRAIQEAEKDQTKEKKETSFRSTKTPQERLKSRIGFFVNYYENLEPMEIMELYLSALTNVYDPHSAFMSPRTEENFDIDMRLSLVGIGAVLTQEDGYTKIVEIVPGGPADREGSLKAEDRIVTVQQETGDPIDVQDMPLNKVVEQIRGAENTLVTLTVLDGKKGAKAIPHKITIKRGKVLLKESEAKGTVREIITQEGRKLKVGVIHLPSFYIDFDAARRGDPNYKSSSRDVKKILQDFRAQKVDGVVMDLRTNGGGSLHEAVLLTGLFIPQGPVVQVKSSRSEIEAYNDEDDGVVEYDGPLIVMINRFSASASEIFAAAIRDYRRGILVGDAKTHGKGTVQVVTDLDRFMPFHFGKKIPAGSLKMTNAKFYRINGESTQLRGVNADIAFPAFTDIMEIGEEKLDRALPWDTITPAEYETCEYPWSVTKPLLEKLRANSRERVSESKEFKMLKADIQEYDKLKARKEVTLNLENRWKEYLQEKKLQEEQMRLFDIDRKKKKDKKNSDLYLDETMNIMKDYIKFATIPK